MNETGQSPSDLEDIIPEAREFVKDVEERLKTDPKFVHTDMGHAATTMAWNLRFQAELEADPVLRAKVQREGLIVQAKGYLKQFGPQIIDSLRDELKLVIQEENLLDEFKK